MADSTKVGTRARGSKGGAHQQCLVGGRWITIVTPLVKRIFGMLPCDYIRIFVGCHFSCIVHTNEAICLGWILNKIRTIWMQNTMPNSLNSIRCRGWITLKGSNDDHRSTEIHRCIHRSESSAAGGRTLDPPPNIINVNFRIFHDYGECKDDYDITAEESNFGCIG